MTDKESVRACQAEIRRLRRIVRDYAALIKDSLHIDYKELFELWGDFDDSAAANEVNQIIEDYGLGSYDAISFIAFCFGYEKAMENFKETA
ncbi:hypothetical protein FACS189483_05220 [Spirochaetia bacterium]|nr:hypothetical protein FACS189483_05220 [Spirochaetia bacterium]